MGATIRKWARRAAGQGLPLALLALGALFSFLTWQDQPTDGAAGGQALAAEVRRQVGAGGTVLIVVRPGAEDRALAEAAAAGLAAAGLRVVGTVRGGPAEVREELDRLAAAKASPDAVAASPGAAAWPVLERRRVVTPPTYAWPSFLKADNLLNVANQIAVIAILAVGMTLVILTGGIDLSVGSLMALAAVLCTLLIREAAGAESASAPAMALCGAAAVAACALVGLLSGTLVTAFGVPPFLATLAVMLVASGLAFLASAGQSIYELPDSFTWLGRGSDLARVPNAVVLALALYAVAHVVLTRTTFGRYVYAAGGNAEAARLSGVPVRRVVVAVYVLSAALAGLGGVVMASQLKSGAPTYGQMYELYVIAAVVVGGTSLSGGEGRVGGTLLGALLIAVIQNGMNLTGVESYTQKVVLGAVILVAVLLDRLKVYRRE